MSDDVQEAEDRFRCTSSSTGPERSFRDGDREHHRPSLHPQNDRVGDEGIGEAILEYLNYYRFPPVYVTRHGEKKHETPLCPHVRGRVHRAMCREDALYAYGERWCGTCRSMQPPGHGARSDPRYRCVDRGGA